MVADMAAGMEVDNVADKIDDIMADMAADKKKEVDVRTKTKLMYV